MDEEVPLHAHMHCLQGIATGRRLMFTRQTAHARKQTRQGSLDEKYIEKGLLFN